MLYPLVLSMPFPLALSMLYLLAQSMPCPLVLSMLCPLTKSMRCPLILSMTPVHCNKVKRRNTLVNQTRSHRKKKDIDLRQTDNTTPDADIEHTTDTR